MTQNTGRAMAAWATRSIVTLVVLMAYATTSVRAQEEGGEAIERVNAVAVFLGGTFEPADRGDGGSVTLGLSYHRRLSQLFTLGAFGEGAFGETEREALLGVSALVHVVADLALVVAPLVEFSQERGSGETHTKAGLRAGALYEFSIGEPYLFAPEAYLDFVDGDVMLVIGGSVALEF